MKQNTETQSSGARIKALSHRMRRFRFTGNFSMTTLSALVLVLFAVLAVTLQLAIGLPPSPEAIAIIIGVLAANGIIIAIVPLWSVVLLMTVTFWAVTGYLVPENMLPALLVGAAGLLVAPGIQIVQQWDRAVVFRLGKFKRVLEPGPHVIFPVLDSVIGHVDMRIRVTDFSAERSVTSDTVPVHVDALAFWMVWDAEKALLEVEDYFSAVTLSAQTVLRDTIGRNELATLLSDRRNARRTDSGNPRPKDESLGHYDSFDRVHRDSAPERARGRAQPTGAGRTRAAGQGDPELRGRGNR